jgi:hypothetical protein
MADWMGSARSNYFRVKDEEAFKAWVETLPGVVAEQKEEAKLPDADAPGRSEKRHCLLETDGYGWPSSRWDPQTGDQRELDLYAELSEHLLPGEVAVLQEVGAEKLRYLTGVSVAVNSAGETIVVDLDEVYEKVKEAGWAERVGTATY